MSVRLTIEKAPANRPKLVHLGFHRGEQKSYIVRPKDANRVLIQSVVACRIGFCHGRYQNPGDSVEMANPVVVQMVDNEARFTLTSAQTREFEAGQPYCWLMELELSDGRIETYWEGNVYPFKEVV